MTPFACLRLAEMKQRKGLGERECEIAMRLNKAGALTPYYYDRHWGREGARAIRFAASPV